jgi:hypothetical protein
METSIAKIRPASPLQPALQPLDKRPRVTPPEGPPHAGVKLTAPKRSKRRKHRPPEFGSPEDVISREVVELLGNDVVARAEADAIEWESPFGFREEVELTVSSISSSGMSYFEVCANDVLFISSVHLRSLLHNCMIVGDGRLQQVRDLPLHRRRRIHGSSLFHSRYPGRLFAPACTGMQGCTPLQT